MINMFVFLVTLPLGLFASSQDLELSFLPLSSATQSLLVEFLGNQDVANLAETSNKNKSTLIQTLTQRHEEFKKGPRTKALLCEIIKGRKKQRLIQDLPLSLLKPLAQHVENFVKDDMDEDERDSIVRDTMRVVQIKPQMLFEFVKTCKQLTKDAVLDATKSFIIYSVADVAKIRPERFDDFKRIALRFTSGMAEEPVRAKIIYAVSYAATSRYASLPAFLEHAEEQTLMITDPKQKAEKLLELAKAFSR